MDFLLASRFSGLSYSSTRPLSNTMILCMCVCIIEHQIVVMDIMLVAYITVEPPNIGDNIIIISTVLSFVRRLSY